MSQATDPQVVPVTKIALSFREASAYVGLCRRTIEKLIAIGEFPKPRVIRGTTAQRFVAAEIKAWFESQPDREV